MRGAVNSNAKRPRWTESENRRRQRSQMLHAGVGMALPEKTHEVCGAGRRCGTLGWQASSCHQDRPPLTMAEFPAQSRRLGSWSPRCPGAGLEIALGSGRRSPQEGRLCAAGTWPLESERAEGAQGRLCPAGARVPTKPAPPGLGFEASPVAQERLGFEPPQFR